jgi:hypothetical protein
MSGEEREMHILRSLLMRRLGLEKAKVREEACRILGGLVSSRWPFFRGVRGKVLRL